ncbi:hypothetical protein BMS3Bbin15_00636 [archaeon BMS3Bbin15]|nr:hypothetical protein BMS3Bbin15_00636 [archaeon BMS3Bbin15]
MEKEYSFKIVMGQFIPPLKKVGFIALNLIKPGDENTG